MWPNLPPKAITEQQREKYRKAAMWLLCFCIAALAFLEKTDGTTHCQGRALGLCQSGSDSSSTELPGLSHTSVRMMTATVSRSFF